ncbi:MAG: hypothetical protein ACOC1D_04635 [Prolixibacteraceae bacterium]
MMKTIEKMKVLIVSIALFCSLPGLSQKHESHVLVLHPHEFTGPIHVSPDDFPKGNIINMVGGWGGMAVTVNEVPAGTDYTPVLVGLKDDLCQVPHWGYLEKGKLRIIDKNKKTTVVNGGDVFYMPPGHTAIIDEDSKVIEFSPEKGMHELNKHVKKRVAEMQNNQ